MADKEDTFSAKDKQLIREAIDTLLASYERQINSKNNELIKETYRAMKRELELTLQKLVLLNP